MVNKTEIDCPNCNQKVRIPSGKHIKFICPKCSNEFEIDGRIKENTKKANYSFIYAIILGGSIMFSYNHFIKNKKTKKVETVNNNVDFEKNLNILVQAVDVSNEITNDFAVRLASRFSGEYNIGQICQIYDYIVKNWKYVNDSDKMENFRTASRTIKNNFSGDCDDFAILLAAMIESIGGDSRVSLAFNDEDGHAFTEVFVASNKENMQKVVDGINTVYGTNKFRINYTLDKDGKYWLNLDWFGKPKHPGGEYFKFNKRTIYYPTAKKPFYTLE